MKTCIHPHCNNLQMTDQERKAQFVAGFVGITMYDQICSPCFDLLKEEI